MPRCHSLTASLAWFEPASGRGPGALRWHRRPAPPTRGAREVLCGSPARLADHDGSGAALGSGRGGDREGRLLVLQAVSLIANRATAETITERIVDVLEAPDPSGVDLDIVEEALALVEGAPDDPQALEEARGLLETSVEIRAATGYGSIPEPGRRAPVRRRTRWARRRERRWCSTPSTPPWGSATPATSSSWCWPPVRSCWACSWRGGGGPPIAPTICVTGGRHEPRHHRPDRGRGRRPAPRPLATGRGRRRRTNGAEGAGVRGARARQQSRLEPGGAHGDLVPDAPGDGRLHRAVGMTRCRRCANQSVRTIMTSASIGSFTRGPALLGGPGHVTCSPCCTCSASSSTARSSDPARATGSSARRCCS